MDDTLAVSEIVELGIQIEINGRDFYTTLIGKSKNKKAKETFRLLAGEEEKHIADFRIILDSIHKYEPKEAYPQEYFAYMNSLASNCVFTQRDKGKEIAKTVRDEKEAIALGIKAEKDSITFYEGMKKILPENDKKVVDEIINQEKRHLQKLESLKVD